MTGLHFMWLITWRCWILCFLKCFFHLTSKTPHSLGLPATSLTAPSPPAVLVAGIYCKSSNMLGISPWMRSLSLMKLSSLHKLFYLFLWLQLLSITDNSWVYNFSLFTLDSTVYFILQLGGATGTSHLIHPKPHFWSCSSPSCCNSSHII